MAWLVDVKSMMRRQRSIIVPRTGTESWRQQPDWRLSFCAFDFGVTTLAALNVIPTKRDEVEWFDEELFSLANQKSWSWRTNSCSTTGLVGQCRLEGWSRKESEKLQSKASCMAGISDAMTQWHAKGTTSGGTGNTNRTSTNSRDLNKS